MKQKRKYKQLTHQDAVAIVRGYHFGGRTQHDLASEYGVDIGYVSRLCHGGSRPEVYAEVKASSGRSAKAG